MSARRPRRVVSATRGGAARSAPRRGPARHGVAAHPHATGGVRAGCAVVTVSDSRGPAADASGDCVQRLLEAAGHRVVARRWVRDEVAAIRRAARELLRRRDVDAMIVTGGTGVAVRDVTPEALEPLYARALPGFGERFRARSQAQVGAAAWLSRASAGVASGRLIVLLPGSTRAVALALNELLLPELAHVLRLIGTPSARE